MKNCIKLEFEDVVCYIDIEKKEVYSYRWKLLSGLKHARTPVPYYIIQYHGKKVTKSLNQLLEIANEKLQSENR